MKRGRIYLLTLCLLVFLSACNAAPATEAESETVQAQAVSPDEVQSQTQAAAPDGGQEQAAAPDGEQSQSQTAAPDGGQEQAAAPDGGQSQSQTAAPDTELNSQGDEALKILPETQYQTGIEVLERSLLATGNVSRFSKAFEKAANGEEVTVAFIGGSITEGLNANAETCYAALTVNWMKRVFNNKNIKLINAGESGTGSKLGVMRVTPQVLDAKPDIVFIEFAVNDGTDADSNSAYESLIRKNLNGESEPAVGLLFTVLKNGYSNQDNMAKIGAYYALPMFTVKDSIFAEITAGNMTWEDYSNDESHPHTDGHKMVAEIMQYGLEAIYNQAAEGTASGQLIPNMPTIGRRYEDIVFLNKNNFDPEDIGSFTKETSDTKPLLNGGWKRAANDESADPFKFTLTAKEVYLIYWETPGYGNPHAGSAEIYVNGELKTTADANKNWGNPAFLSIAADTQASELKFEIKPAPDTLANPFWILGIAYIP
ncbi:MAG: GDSL-type esterase/lipase family protein [Clostridiales bacterium]|nr:GDSL-type esterase/lipase family protein [Clostridiales bacterium]